MAAGSTTRYQKNAPKPTMKMVVSSDTCSHGTRIAAARISHSAAAARGR